MKPVIGFADVFGVELRRRRYLGQTFGSVAESFGFEPLEIPIVEHAAAYSEEIVGLSPWPEWNARGIFGLTLSNYNEHYQDTLTPTEAVLVPEGTLSVTRWLGDKLSELPDPLHSTELPLKIYYEVGCYRNELLSTLSTTKGRQFTQFGIEILGGKSICADLEVMAISAEALRALGVGDASIVFRISSNKLYTDLTRRSGFTHAESVTLKEALDTIGECKAGKHPERLPVARDAVLDALQRRAVSDELQRIWLYMIDRRPSPITADDFRMLGEAHSAEVRYLETICKLLGRHALRVDVDFCVVRSHEYYTGLTFEIDLLDDAGNRHVEVGGGGRYDRLLGNFIESVPGLIIPSTGYAFGLERLQSALVQTGHLVGTVNQAPHVRSLSPNAVDKQLFDERGSDLEIGERYLATVDGLRSRRLHEAVSVAFL